MRPILIFLLLFILPFVSCEKASYKDTAMLNTKWILSYLQETKTNVITNYPTDAARKVSIVFSDSSNILFFSGVCNGGRGTYSYFPRTHAVQITDMVTTLIGCKYAEWEGYTVQNLDGAYAYKIDGGNLIIYSKGSYNLYFISN